MAYFIKNQPAISTCVWDSNQDGSKEICLNDVVEIIKTKEIGFITKRKGEYYFENRKTLIPLKNFDGATPNQHSKTNELLVIDDPKEIEQYIRYILESFDCL